MIKTTVKVDGMMCGMCEAHINDACRRDLPLKKVTSSHTKGETVIIAADNLTDDIIRAAIGSTGYTVVSVERAPYEKRGFFTRLFGK